jgi:purine-binding chemotaxis protein CheW
MSVRCMPPGTSSHPSTGAAASRASLLAELRALEARIQRTQVELLALGGDSLPGLHLVVEVAGRRGLLASHRVAEIVQLVSTVPLAGAPGHVLGTFLNRGGPVVVVDLAVLLDVRREPALDAQIVILAGAPPVGLVVDKVEKLVDSPRIFSGDAAAAMPESWRGSPFVAGLCVEQGEVLPLLDPQPIVADLPREGA